MVQKPKKKTTVRLGGDQRVQLREAGQAAEVRADALREVQARDTPRGGRVLHHGRHVLLLRLSADHESSLRDDEKDGAMTSSTATASTWCRSSAPLQRRKPPRDNIHRLFQNEAMKRPAVFAEALALPTEDRLELAAELLASAPPVPGLLVEGTPEFRAELARRLEEVRTGSARLIPWEEVRETILESLHGSRGLTAERTRRR